MEKPTRPATITDVAKWAKVSIAAVSRVMSGDESLAVRDETRQRIYEAARELNYQPNRIARSLRVSRTFSLGIVVPELENPVHPRIIAGAEKAAAKLGYSLLIAHRFSEVPDATIYRRLVQQSRVDGLIIATLQDEEVQLAILEELGCPFVLVNRKAKDIDHFVVVDDQGGARKAVEYLIGLGHKRIAHLSGAPDRYNSRCRMDGYLDALKTAGIDADPKLIAVAGYTQSGGVNAMRAILDSVTRPPTAVFATTLLVAAGAMSVLRDKGLRVPEDVSVIGFHDGPIAEVLAPPLTTVSVPLNDVGYQATTALVNHLEGKGDFHGWVLPETKIVVRASTAPCPEPA